ncbi:hypothetical protein SAMN03097699_0066 [Flavobacteriaceae bacterium MAR_2010_188]|nr:hypothetical protein SAMN03097699_0066 [Flavobacteriaceae bacterium MAR_2010_188]
MSLYKNDIRKEQILNQYLDRFYNDKGFEFNRISDKNLQLKGIDLLIHHDQKEFRIDEKAQLHYLNKDLPTFTFELSYLNNQNELRKGWLLNSDKQTDYYFLVTAIFLKDNAEELLNMNDIKKVKITSVNRYKLLSLLTSKNLNLEQLQFYDESIRFNNYYGKNLISELDCKTEGLIHYSEHLSEKPLNLQLRLQFLLDYNVAKRL